jgi:hypothetical protein
MRIWLCVTAISALLPAQVQQPQPRYYPADQEKNQIHAKLAELTAAAGKLEGNPLYPDVAIYQKAADFILAHPEEFVKASFVKDTLDVLDKGLTRQGARRRLVFLDEEQRTFGTRLPFDYRRQPAAIRFDHSEIVFRPTDPSGHLDARNQSGSERSRFYYST